MRFTELIASEYGDRGILVYSIHFGAVETDMTCAIPDDFGGFLVDAPELAGHTVL